VLTGNDASDGPADGPADEATTLPEGGTMARYRMRQRLLSWGRDFDIEDERGNPAFHVDGKVLRIRRTFVMTDMSGAEVATVRQKVLALRRTIHIFRNGAVIATVRKALFSPIRDRFAVEVTGGADLEITGDILDHEYEIRRGRDTVARVSKRWFTLRDTYGIETPAGEDDPLLLAIAVALDEMSHAPHRRKG
jgi:uncharacterized protein YxjI